MCTEKNIRFYRYMTNEQYRSKRWISWFGVCACGCVFILSFVPSRRKPSRSSHIWHDVFSPCFQSFSSCRAPITSMMIVIIHVGIHATHLTYPWCDVLTITISFVSFVECMMLDEKKASNQISLNTVQRHTRSVLRSARSVVLFFKLKESEEEGTNRANEYSRWPTYQRSTKSQNSAEKYARGRLGGASLTIHSISSKMAKPLWHPNPKQLRAC